MAGVEVPRGARPGGVSQIQCRLARHRQAAPAGHSPHLAIRRAAQCRNEYRTLGRHGVRSRAFAWARVWWTHFRKGRHIITARSTWDRFIDTADMCRRIRAHHRKSDSGSARSSGLATRSAIRSAMAPTVAASRYHLHRGGSELAPPGTDHTTSTTCICQTTKRPSGIALGDGRPSTSGEGALYRVLQLLRVADLQGPLDQ